MEKGILISIEGIDGCGKTTLAQNLKLNFEEKKQEILLTQEPGGTSLGKKLRAILHEEKDLTCDLSEYLLFAADRAQHFKQIIISALKENKIVISDRLSDSSLAYQGYGRGLDIEMIKKTNKWAMQNIEPDFIIYVKIDTQTALQRIGKRNEKLTSFEKEKIDFWNKVIKGYEEIFKNKKNVIIVDGNLPPDILAKQTCEKLNN
ncbi:MAG: dTMP kinase [bacterium]